MLLISLYDLLYAMTCELWVKIPKGRLNISFRKKKWNWKEENLFFIYISSSYVNIWWHIKNQSGWKTKRNRRKRVKLMFTIVRLTAWTKMENLICWDSQVYVLGLDKNSWNKHSPILLMIHLITLICRWCTHLV